MSYAQALGYDLVIDMPAPLPAAHINVPLEKMAADAVNAAWPSLQTKIEAEIPHLVTVAAAQIPTLLPEIMKTAESQLLTTFLPQVQPKIQAQVDAVMSKAVGYGIVGGLVLVASQWAAARWIKGGGSRMR